MYRSFPENMSDRLKKERRRESQFKDTLLDCLLLETSVAKSKPLKRPREHVRLTDQDNRAGGKSLFLPTIDEVLPLESVKSLEILSFQFPLGSYNTL